MLRIHRFDWNFSSTAEMATAVLLAVAVAVLFV
jgi:hypothetical protein